MKKAFLTSALFTLMLVLTSFQVDTEIGGNKGVPKPELPATIELNGNKVLLQSTELPSYVMEIGGNKGVPKPELPVVELDGNKLLLQSNELPSYVMEIGGNKGVPQDKNLPILTKFELGGNKGVPQDKSLPKLG